MGHLAVFLDVTGKPCLVVGGGEVAERKAHSLLDAGAEVTVISPSLNNALAAIAGDGNLRHTARRYRRGDLTGFLLVYAATDDPAVHREIAAEAHELGIPINVADSPELCSFFAPAVVRRGDLQIAISTGGASPAIASRLRREIGSLAGPEYALLLRILRSVRTRLSEIEPNIDERGRKLRALANSPICEYLRANDFPAVDAALSEHLGPSITLKELGFDVASLNGSPDSIVDRSR